MVTPNICIATCYPPETPGIYFRVTRELRGFTATGRTVSDEDFVCEGYGATIEEAIGDAWRTVAQGPFVVGFHSTSNLNSE